MTLYYEWSNSVKIKFGKNVVQNYLGEYIKPNSKILCTFGFGSIEKNGCKSDVVAALEKLKCTVQWEGGLQANPDVSRCVEIVAAVKKFNPDLILAVGGGSVLDATKFISLAAKLPEGKDP
jgi:alcohol dehydrogenase YqhD (iron-dependent ADH family)